MDIVLLLLFVLLLSGGSWGWSTYGRLGGIGLGGGLGAVLLVLLLLWVFGVIGGARHFY